MLHPVLWSKPPRWSRAPMAAGTVVPWTLPCLLAEVTVASACFGSRGVKPLLGVTDWGELEPRDALGEKERSRRTSRGPRRRSPPPLWSRRRSRNPPPLDPVSSWPDPSPSVAPRCREKGVGGERPADVARSGAGILRRHHTQRREGERPEVEEEHCSGEWRGGGEAPLA